MGRTTHRFTRSTLGRRIATMANSDSRGGVLDDRCCVLQTMLHAIAQVVKVEASYVVSVEFHCAICVMLT